MPELPARERGVRRVLHPGAQRRHRAAQPAALQEAPAAGVAGPGAEAVERGGDGVGDVRLLRVQEPPPRRVVASPALAGSPHARGACAGRGGGSDGAGGGAGGVGGLEGGGRGPVRALPRGPLGLGGRLGAGAVPGGSSCGRRGHPLGLGLPRSVLLVRTCTPVRYTT